MRGDRGFTLIELMIVIAIVAVIAAIAIPNLLQARQGANEASAVSMLRSIHSAQEMFRARDLDKDSIPDYAESTGELTSVGLIAIDGWADTALYGTVPFVKSGYQFTVIEDSLGIAHMYTWSCLAVPIVPGKSGTQTFLVDETGTIRYTTEVITSLEQVPNPTSGWPPVGR